MSLYICRLFEKTLNILWVAFAGIIGTFFIYGLS